MFYTLNENVVLRGWIDYPHAVRDLSTGRTLPIHKEVFEALQFCSGLMDFDSFIIPEHYKRIVAWLDKEKIVMACERGCGNKPHQAYMQYPCNYITTAHWSITGKCNMRCRHCFMSAPQAKYGELSHENCLNIIEQLSEAGIGEINLTGGEPLVRTDFFDLVKALRKKNIAIRQIYTNGMLVNQKLLDDLADLGVKPAFSVSFDGVGWHDWLRGFNGAEEIAVDAIRLLVKNGHYVGVESAFHRESIGSITETMRLLADLGVSQWKTNPVGNAGNWCNENKNLDLTTDELYSVYLDLIEKYFEVGSPLTVMFGGFFMCRKGTKNYRIPCKKNASESAPLCTSARQTMYITPEGRLLPCMPIAGLPFAEEMPDLNTARLTDALSDSNYLRIIDMPISELIAHNEDCQRCEHKDVCGGGCRAYALMENEGADYLGVDPSTCFFFKNGYEEKIARIASKFM